MTFPQSLLQMAAINTDHGLTFLCYLQDVYNMINEYKAQSTWVLS